MSGLDGHSRNTTGSGYDFWVVVTPEALNEKNDFPSITTFSTVRSFATNIQGASYTRRPAI